MKIIRTFLIISIWHSAFSQKSGFSNSNGIGFLDSSNFLPNEMIEDVKNIDLSPLWTNTPNHVTYGLISSEKRRIRIKILEVKKITPLSYKVSGKSKVDQNICSFSGTITITSVRHLRLMHFGVDDMFKNDGIRQQAVMTSSYNFAESPLELNAGIFYGRQYSQWYVDKLGKVRYDDIERNSDSYSNNQFVGYWQAYNSKETKVCNWGDCRVPFSGDLDIGAGEFSPNDKYLQFGWKSYQEAFIFGNDTARQEEQSAWWK